MIRLAPTKPHFLFCMSFDKCPKWTIGDVLPSELVDDGGLKYEFDGEVTVDKIECSHIAHDMYVWWVYCTSNEIINYSICIEKPDKIWPKLEHIDEYLIWKEMMNTTLSDMKEIL